MDRKDVFKLYDRRLKIFNNIIAPYTKYYTPIKGVIYQLKNMKIEVIKKFLFKTCYL